MDKIILQGLVDKWHGSLRYLKGHQNELSPEEWSAIEVLQDLWRNMSYGPDMVREANEMLDVLIGCDKYHSNNRDIITHSKNFRATAKKFYTESATTFNEIRSALQPPRRTPVTTPQPRPEATPEDRDTAQALTSGVLLSYVKDWQRGMQYLTDHEDELDEDEVKAMAILLSSWQNLRPDSRQAIVAAVKTLKDCERLHNSNRDIITNSKYVTAASRKYSANDRLLNGFSKALKEYLKKNPIDRPAPFTGCPIRITGIKIGEHDSVGNWVPSQFYTDLTYLYVRVYYERLNPKCNSVDLGLRFINPSGILDKNSSTPGFTLREQSVPIQQSGFMDLGGWGNKNGHGFCTGTWTVEAFINGTRESKVNFTMRDRAVAYTPPIEITGVSFKNVDKNGNVLSGTVDSSTHYLAPVINVHRLRPSGEVTVYYRIYNSAGVMLKGSLNDYTWRSSFTPTTERMTHTMGGFGNSDGNYWTPGSYNVEFYVDGRRIYSTTINIPRKQAAPPPPPPPRPAGGGKKSRAWLWILGIITVVGSYFGFDAYTESRADRAATVMYAISDTDFFKNTGSDKYDEEHLLKEGDKVLVYNTDTPGWAYAKGPSGKKGYVATSSLVSGGDNELLQLVTGEEGNPNLDTSHKRAALLHLLRSDNIDEEYVRYWKIDNCGVDMTPNSVNYTRLNDGTDPELKTLSMVLHNSETGERKIAIYAFPSANKPELRYFADAPADKDISYITYKPSRKYYYVNYASGDKRVSTLSKPDNEHPFIVTGLQFVDINQNRRLVSNYVGKRAQYVAPKITYRTNTSGSVTLKVKLFDSYTGEMLKSSNSGVTDYTYSTSFSVNSKGRGTETLDGWGNPDKTAWSGGTDRRFEIYFGDTLVASGRVAP